MARRVQEVELRSPGGVEVWDPFDGGDEWAVAGRVGRDEGGARGEGSPWPADGAEAAQRLGWDSQQDLVDRVLRQQIHGSLLTARTSKDAYV